MSNAALAASAPPQSRRKLNRPASVTLTAALILLVVGAVALTFFYIGSWVSDPQAISDISSPWLGRLAYLVAAGTVLAVVGSLIAIVPRPPSRSRYGRPAVAFFWLGLLSAVVGATIGTVAFLADAFRDGPSWFDQVATLVGYLTWAGAAVALVALFAGATRARLVSQ
jgi:hypothetical protein